MYKCVITMLFVTLIVMPLSAMTAQQIVQAMDELETFEQSYSEGQIITTDRFGEKKSTFRGWSQGTHDSLIEFTCVAERGQKILRTSGQLYLFYPDAEELIRLQGAALRQGMLGSDISYEDMTGERDTLSDYTAELLDTEQVQGKSCYVIKLTAKTRTVAYPIQKLWVDTETFMVWKGEFSTQSGRLLKEMEVLQTMEVEGRTLAQITRISDKMKRDSATEMHIDLLDLSVDLDPTIFTLQNLTW